VVPRDAECPKLALVAAEEQQHRMLKDNKDFSLGQCGWVLLFS